MERSWRTPGGREAQAKRLFCIPEWSNAWRWQFEHQRLQEDYSRTKRLQKGRRGDER